MKNQPLCFLVFCLILSFGPSLRAGYVYSANDSEDGCGSGSGGGGGAGGGASGGSGGPGYGATLMGGDIVSPPGCLGTCGSSPGGNPGAGGGGGTGGGGAGCCQGGEEDDSSQGPGNGALLNSWSGSGMPIWEVSEPYINLWLYDEPLGYQPGIGPRISFRLAYKQRGSTPDVSTNIFSLGDKWTCSWLSYVEDDGTGTQAALNLRGGGRVMFYPDGASKEYYTQTTLQRIINGEGNLAGFVRTYRSGAQDYYQDIPEHSVTLPDGNTPAFLSARLDPAGRVVSSYS